MGAVAVGFGVAVQTLLSPPVPPGRAAFGVARPEPPTHTGNPTMNDNHHNQPESVEERIERLEIQKIRLETQLIEAGMRRDPRPPGARHRQVDRHHRRRGLGLHRRRPARLVLGPSVQARRLWSPRLLFRSGRRRSQHSIRAALQHCGRCAVLPSTAPSLPLRRAQQIRLNRAHNDAEATCTFREELV